MEQGPERGHSEYDQFQKVGLILTGIGVICRACKWTPQPDLISDEVGPELPGDPVNTAGVGRMPSGYAALLFLSRVRFSGIGCNTQFPDVRRSGHGIA
jgi:hypothetical protein